MTQCPIPVGTNFTYKVILSDEEGTVFWHAHSDWTRATVHGAFVILPDIGTSYPFPTPDFEQVLVFGKPNSRKSLMFYNFILIPHLLTCYASI